jgi:hypothetical protein
MLLGGKDHVTTPLHTRTQATELSLAHAHILEGLPATGEVRGGGGMMRLIARAGRFTGEWSET